jgi:uncharacterized circularly permuted ATP-grasp superfamily protein
MSAHSLSATVAELDNRIFNDPGINPALFEALTTAQRELGLLHGDRPTCPFLRPHILSSSQYSSIAAAAEIIAGAFERLVEHALESPELLRELGLTDAEERMARIDPGYSRLCVTSRLDTYLTDSGFHFLEYNAESPAGIADQMQLEKILYVLPHMREFLEKYKTWQLKPHEQLLKSLLAAYREWGGAEKVPQIAIVDWEGVSTASEFEVLKTYFESCGYKTMIIDPRALEYHDTQLRAGTFRIDIIYKRIIIHEFLEKFDESHPLSRAYIDRTVCIANSFRTKIAHKKAGFAILSDQQYSYLFTASELDIIRQHIPWTRIVRQGTTSFGIGGSERELSEILETERERLVLKPNDDYGGHGIVIGWETPTEAWREAIAVAFSQSYVVQERVPVKKVAIPMFTDHVKAEEMFVDFNPFLFQNKVAGGLVRLSASSLCNVSSGGGQTALLVLEDT